MALAVVLSSCANKMKLATADLLDVNQRPEQVVDSMYVVQTDKGDTQMRMMSPRMERYSSDTSTLQLFPFGIEAFAYDEQGHLETRIRADEARHEVKKHRAQSEEWVAYGNVVVENLINRQRLETDTLYWDKDKEKIFTDAYVRLISPDGFMQGYGMESDQRGRNSVIKHPFNSYGVMDNDSTKVVLDSVNFTGPFPLNLAGNDE